MKENRLVKADYAIAEMNGIGRNTLENRVYNLQWDKQRALTEPVVTTQNLWLTYKDIAVVSKATFYKRIRDDKLSPERAATDPPKTRNKKVRK